jgi:hypothetical protein
MPPFSSAELLRLYPNPTSSTSRLEAAAIIEVLRIWDTQGREVFSTQPRAYFYELPSLPAGTYKVQVIPIPGKGFLNVGG